MPSNRVRALAARLGAVTAWQVRGRPLWLWLAVLLLALGGAGLGVAVGGGTDHEVGPLRVHLQLVPAVHGGTRIDIAPLGSLHLDTHRGPVALKASVDELDPRAAQALVNNPASFGGLGFRIAADARGALLAVLVRSSVAAVLGATLACLLVLRRVRLAALAALLAVLGLGVTGGTASATWRPTALQEPRYTGLLVNAPTAVGSVQLLVTNFDSYRAALTQLVGNVSQLYRAASALPSFQPGPDTIAVLQVSDLHLNPAGTDLVRSLVTQFHPAAVLDSGDLTDHGTTAEGRYVALLRSLGVPYVFVRGNHDSATTAAQVAAVPGTVVLDRSVATVAGLRVAGIADTRFTPDKDTRAGSPQPDALQLDGRALADVIRTATPPVDIAIIHDPAAAAELDGVVPLVLSGHLHHRDTSLTDGTLHLVQGSTGGAGLRGLEGESPTPLQASVLYFSRATHRLVAWDDVSLGGLGTSSVKVERHRPPAAYRQQSPSPSPAASPTG